MKLLPLSALLLTLTSSYAMALSSDTEQPVYIDSDTQQLDMKSNEVTFLGDVTLKQGSIAIRADKIVVLRNPADGSIKQIQGYGQPATFSQKTDEGKLLSGEANKLDYQLTKDNLTMTGNATLAQDGNTIKGSSIRYHIKSQKLVADSTANERVTTVLQPAKKPN